MVAAGHGRLMTYNLRAAKRFTYQRDAEKFRELMTGGDEFYIIER